MAFIALLLLMLFVKDGTVTGERMIELGSWLSPRSNQSSWHQAGHGKEISNVPCTIRLIQRKI
ncbi:hypothetical protein Fmac_012815 [Flemingia macrophylla]|uniref:Uncharacterized protein n=1 Tax=Flemingia macrophylla TaxID=520843 RepID=A0ABD1MRC8_9FABA